MADKKYWALALGGIAIASGAAWWFQNHSASPQPAAGADAARPAASAASGPASGPNANRPMTVEVAKVESMTLLDETQAVGSLRSRQGVMLRPEISGRIRQILFSDGQRVQRGQLLVQFDDQLPMAQLSQAKAELSIAQANHKRNLELVTQNFISKRSADESAAALEVAQAKLALAEATVQRLKIVAPFDGVMGLRQVNVGDYLKDGADIVNIEDMDALFVDFRLPERYQTKVRTGQTTRLNVDALPGRPFTALVKAVDPLVDANGRSVGLRGCVDNRQQALRPGMFARVNVLLDRRENALVVPEEAIIPQGGRSFVVKVVPGDKPDTLVSQRVPVAVGLRILGKVEILDGLALGDTVVATGHQRLQRDGTPVRPVDLSRGRPGGPGQGGPGQGGAAGPASAASAPQGAASGAAPAASGAAPAGPMVAGRPGSAAPGRPAGARPAAAEGPNPCLKG